jgi:hypothetical protein
VIDYARLAAQAADFQRQMESAKGAAEVYSVDHEIGKWAGCDLPALRAALDLAARAQSAPEMPEVGEIAKRHEADSEAARVPLGWSTRMMRAHQDRATLLGYNALLAATVANQEARLKAAGRAYNAADARAAELAERVRELEQQDLEGRGLARELKQQRDAWDDERAAAVERAEKAEVERDDLQRELRAVREERDAAVLALEQDRAEMVGRLREEIAGLKGERDRLRTEVARLSQQLVEVDAERSALRAALVRHCRGDVDCPTCFGRADLQPCEDCVINPEREPGAEG